MGSIQSFVIAIAFERDISAWKLGWNLRLVAVIYCGFIVTGVAYYLQSWVIEKRGPVFLSMFTPLSLLFTLLSSGILLCEIIRLGSILGGLLLIIGLYCVLWGKSRELKNIGDQKTDPHKENSDVCNEVKVVIS
ncbi:hypothetical protein Bca52824_060764 [Brassica carinata]|uniref:WAT1-related protein n=1 Tax=Brassica carinata TaxID=52824 RepID=A0A8X7QWL3_BRACI|nr:hypothetical protein Bca52824_060764 [Brassica carinata]